MDRKKIYDGKYEVSKNGKVYNTVSKKNVKNIDNNGYNSVSLKLLNGESQTINVNKLVAEAFIRQIKDDEVIIHIDGNNYNDHFDNLKIEAVVKEKTSKKNVKPIIKDDDNEKDPEEKLICNDKYIINTEGHVFSEKTGEQMSERLLNGYYIIRLNNTFYTLSRLIVESFIRPLNKGEVVNHKDGNKLNNNLTNLEISTQKENVHHAIKNGLTNTHPKRIKQYSVTEEKILVEECSLEEIRSYDKQIRDAVRKNLCGKVKSANGYIWEYNENKSKVNKYEIKYNKKYTKTFDSVKDAADSIGLSRHSITKVLKGDNPTAGGFYWKYETKEIQDDVDIKTMELIEGYDNYYASKDGKIYNLYTHRYLKPIKEESGYTYVTLCKNKIKKNRKVHILIASCYIENTKPETQTQVNHINYIKDDNRAENLEWVTPSENSLHNKNRD